MLLWGVFKWDQHKPDTVSTPDTAYHSIMQLCFIWWPAISKDSLPCVQSYDTHMFWPCIEIISPQHPVPHRRGSCLWWMDCVAYSSRLGFSTSRGRDDPTLVRAARKEERKEEMRGERDREKARHAFGLPRSSFSPESCIRETLGI